MVRITCDSTADLTKAQYEQYGIRAIPLYIHMNGKEYVDGVTIDNRALFEMVAENGELPKTSAVSVEDYIRVWKPLTDAGDEVVHLNISGEMSGCHLSANLAAAELPGVYPVDSRNLSTGIGHLAILASELAEQGKTGREIADILNERKTHLNVSFVLDTMDYLAKGGRCSSVTAFAAGLLKLRLCIEVKDGKMDVAGKYRGKMTKVLPEYVRERLANRNDIDTRRIFITDSIVPEDVRRVVHDAVLECQPFEEILTSEAGCTISSHCGPACLGILYFTK